MSSLHPHNEAEREGWLLVASSILILKEGGNVSLDYREISSVYAEAQNMLRVKGPKDKSVVVSFLRRISSQARIYLLCCFACVTFISQVRAFKKCQVF